MSLLSQMYEFMAKEVLVVECSTCAQGKLVMGQLDDSVKNSIISKMRHRIG